MTGTRPDPYRVMKYVGLGAADGVIFGWILLSILKYLDILRIGTLIAASPDGALAYFMLVFFFGITFGMVGIAWRVMVLLPDEDEERRR